LIDAFINKFNARMEKQITGVTDHVLRRLMSYEYPGNVRELENIIEHAFVLCRGNRIDLDCLPREILQAPEGEHSQVSRQDQTPLGKAEADVIARALRKHGGNRLRAAHELGIDRTTLWRKMHKYGVA
jgi:transcriptional regulator with PAS, ATPase and Fis domain